MLSPKFQEGERVAQITSVEVASARGSRGQSHAGTPGQRHSAGLSQNRSKTKQGQIKISQQVDASYEQDQAALLMGETLKRNDSRDYREILAGTRVPDQCEDTADEVTPGTVTLAPGKEGKLQEPDLVQDFALAADTRDNEVNPQATAAFGAVAAQQLTGEAAVASAGEVHPTMRESHSLRELAAPEDRGGRRPPAPIDTRLPRRAAESQNAIGARSDQQFNSPGLREARISLMAGRLSEE